MKEVEKQTNTAQSPGSEHPRYTERSDPDLDHPGEQGPGLNHPWLAANQEQRLCGRRPTPPGAHEWSI